MKAPVFIIIEPRFTPEETPLPANILKYTGKSGSTQGEKNANNPAINAAPKLT